MLPISPGRYRAAAGLAIDFTAVQPQTRRRPPQGDIELMAEKQIPVFEPASRLEHVGDEHCKQMKDRKHHVE